MKGLEHLYEKADRMVLCVTQEDFDDISWRSFDQPASGIDVRTGTFYTIYTNLEDDYGHNMPVLIVCQKQK